MRLIDSTVSTGYWPRGASRPRASPRRCRRAPRWRRRRPPRAWAPGAAIIDSIICVAVIVSLLRSRAMPDHALLQRRHRGVADLHREVAARHHDAVAGLHDVLERAGSIASARSILAMSSAWPPAARSSSRAMYMSAPDLRKRHREIVGLDLRGGADVLHVLGGERRRGQPAALAVDALVVGQHAAVAHDGVDLGAAHRASRRARSGRRRAAARRRPSRRAAAPCSRGRRARSSPSSQAASRTKASPASSVTLPSLNLPTRILGPCRSAMMPTVRPVLRADLAHQRRRAPRGPRRCRARN